MQNCISLIPGANIDLKLVWVLLNEAKDSATAQKISRTRESYNGPQLAHICYYGART